MRYLLAQFIVSRVAQCVIQGLAVGKHGLQEGGGEQSGLGWLMGCYEDPENGS